MDQKKKYCKYINLSKVIYKVKIIILKISVNYGGIGISSLFSTLCISADSLESNTMSYDITTL